MRVILFIHENLGQIRTLQDEKGETWFLANDIATCLGYERVGDAIAVHTDPEDRKALKYKDFGDSPKAKSLWKTNDFSNKTFINEAGMYQMIFESKMPKAKEFKSWKSN